MSKEKKMTFLILILTIWLIGIGLSLRGRKVGLWLFKGGCLLLFIGGSFIALFFSLMGITVECMNIDLHPWRNYIIWRSLGSIVVAIIVYAISQLPLFFTKRYSKRQKRNILKSEGLVYVLLLIIGIFCLYNGVIHSIPDNWQYGNDMVKMIDEYNENHKTKCKSLEDLGLKRTKGNYYEYNGMWFDLYVYDTGYTLYFRNAKDEDVSDYDVDFVYNSEKDCWTLRE